MNLSTDPASIPTDHEYRSELQSDASETGLAQKRIESLVTSADLNDYVANGLRFA